VLFWLWKEKSRFLRSDPQLGQRPNQQVAQIGDQIRTFPQPRPCASGLDRAQNESATTLQIQAPRTANNKPVLDLKSGGTYFLGRDKPTETEFRTPQTSGAILGRSSISPSLMTGARLSRCSMALCCWPTHRTAPA
jgi:hypothetical protein